MKQSWKKNVSIFLACQMLSIFGSSLVQYAITWHVTLTTKSGVYAALVIICGFIPTFILSPFTGVWADRYNRKTLIMLSDAGIALCTLALAVTFMLGYDMIWLILVAAGVRSLGSAVQNPCVGAMLPDLVPKEQLTRVNGVNGSLQSLIMLVSPMLSGALLSFSDIESVFYVDVITAALSILIMMTFLKVPHKPKAKSGSHVGSDYLSELKAGFRYIGGHAYLRNFFIFCAVFMFMISPAAFLTPLQTARTFGEDVWRLTAVELAFASGMMLGGIIIASWGGMKNRVHTMALGCASMGLCTLAMGFPRYFWVYLAFMGLCGMTVPLFNTPAVVLLQEQANPEYIGRVFGVMTMIGSSIMPLGMLVFGPLADMVRIESLLIGTGAFMLACTFALLGNRPLVEAGVKPSATPKELDVEAITGNLETVLSFINEELSANRCKPELQTKINVAAEEIFVNIAHYAYAPETGRAVIRVSAGKEASLEFSDSGKPFNPLEREDPPIGVPAKERKAGGLGIYMVKRIMDSVEYRYEDGRNILLMKKRLD